MEKNLQVEELSNSIELLKTHITSLEEQVKIGTSSLRWYKSSLRRLKARARSAEQSHYRYSKPIIKNGVEWYTFDTAVKYGVIPEGDGWHLLAGQYANVPVTRALFFFKIKMDDYMRKLIRMYAPGSKVAKSGSELVCYDIRGALMVAQLVTAPKRILLRYETVEGTYPAHTRLYNRKTTKNIKVARKIGEHIG